MSTERRPPNAVAHLRRLQPSQFKRRRARRQVQPMVGQQFSTEQSPRAMLGTLAIGRCQVLPSPAYDLTVPCSPRHDACFTRSH